MMPAGWILMAKSSGAGIMPAPDPAPPVSTQPVLSSRPALQGPWSRREDCLEYLVSPPSRTDRVPVRIYMERASHDRWESLAAGFQLKPSTLLSMVIARAEADPRILQLAIVEPFMQTIVLGLAQSGGMRQNQTDPPTLAHTAPTHPHIHLRKEKTKTPPVGGPPIGGDLSPTPEPPWRPLAEPSAKTRGVGQKNGTRSARGPCGSRGPLTVAELASFDRFWAEVPRKTGKGSARKAWRTALRKVDDAGVIVEGARAWKASSVHADPQFVPHPATWLNAERWLDEEPPPVLSPKVNAATVPLTDAQVSRIAEVGFDRAARERMSDRPASIASPHSNRRPR